MDNDNKAIQIIRKVLLSRLKNVDIEMDFKLKDDLSMDSLRLVELMIAIEKELGVKISVERSLKFSTVRDIADFISIIQKEGNRK